MATAATKAANAKNLAAAGRSSSSTSTYVSTAGNLLDSSGKVVGKAAPGTTGTFTDGLSPISAAGSAASTARATTSTNPNDAPGYDPAKDPLSSVNGGKTPTSLSPTGISTGQPNPSTAQVTPANSLGQATPEQIKAVQNASTAVQGLTDQVANRYKTGLANAKASGVQAPDSGGQAMGMVQSNLPGSQLEPPSVIGSIIETDSNFDSILTMYDEFMSPATQKKSLLQEYDQLSKSLGIQGMNAELIDTKRIIEGTEDDIRSEVTAAGGFATDSQVLSLANARNKSLMKNYNYLLESRDSAMTQLNTMMNLSMEDRKSAEAEFDRKIDFAFKVQEFRDRAASNAREGLNNIVKTSGYAGLLQAAGGDPYRVSLMEKTLGLGSGGLNKLASMPVQGDTQTVAYGDGQALIDSNTGKVIATYPGKTLTGDSSQGANPIGDPTQNALSQLKFLRDTAKTASDLSSASGPSWVTKKLGDTFVGDTKFRQLEAQTNTLRTNVLTLMTDPSVKKYFGPQMSEGDVRLMTAAGTTLNPENQSPKQMKKEIGRLDDLLKRMQESLNGGVAPNDSGGGSYEDYLSAIK